MYAKILVPVDFAPTSAAGLQEAIRLARSGGGQLRLLHVVEERACLPEVLAYPDAADPVGDGMRRGAALLARMQEDVAREGIAVGTVLIESPGQPTAAFIADQAAAWGADLIVLGTHGRRGVGRLVRGSVAEKIMRHATMPVLMIRCPSKRKPSEPGLQSIAGAIA